MCAKSNSISGVIGRQYLLLGFVLRIRLSDGSYKIRFLWWRILLLVIFLCLIAWFSAAALLHAFFKYKRDFSEVAYTDMLFLPIRMAEHRKKMGQYHIKKGLDFYEQKEFGDAFRLLRLGLINAPEHVEGRILVVQFYRDALRRPELAIDVAIKGLDYGGLENPDFLKFLFALMAAEKRDQQICELVEQYLPVEVEISHSHLVMAYAAANAYYHRGHYDEAEQLIMGYKLRVLQDDSGLILFHRIQWARGKKQQTINALEAELRREPNQGAVIHFLVSLYLEEKNYDRARQLALLRSLYAPTGFEPKLDLLQIVAIEGDRSELSGQFDRLYQSYGADKRPRMRLAEFAAQQGMIEQSRNLYLQANEDVVVKDVLAIFLLRSYLNAGEHKQGIEFASSLTNLTGRPQMYLDALLACAHFSLKQDTLADLHIKSFMQFSGHQAMDFGQFALDLIAIDRQEIALEMLKKALELDDENQAVLAEALKLELELSDLESIQARLELYLATRRPDKMLLKTCYDKLVGDRFMFDRNRTPLLMKLRAYL